MMVLISDLFVEAADIQRGLRLLRQRGHDVLVLHVLDDDELDFPFARPARFEGLETDDQLTCNPRALREGYLQALHQSLATVRHNGARHNVDYALIRTSMPLDAALTAFLRHRLRERQR
jgi:glycine/D-amino acid oxidase-like deaminating enzyme